VPAGDQRYFVRFAAFAARFSFMDLAGAFLPSRAVRCSLAMVGSLGGELRMIGPSGANPTTHFRRVVEPHGVGG
jgi:hypothetical protein